MAGEPVSVGPFSFDRRTGALSRDGKPIAIGTRGAALLAALVEADGAVVGKEALIEAGWPGLTVEEGNLSVQVANLRKAMGPRPDGQDWIVTVLRVGYRLLIASASHPDPAEPVLPSLAVLPFANLSGDPEQEYFADGVVEDIITALSRFKSFAVVARNSSFVFKGRAVDVRQVARELGVGYVLEGGVQKSGNRLRITVQLVDGVSGTQLWADKFDRSIEDVFDVQDQITTRVAGEVGPGVQLAEVDRGRRERPSSVAAYDLYLKALAKMPLVTESLDREAYELARAGLELDANSGRILAMAVHSLQVRIRLGWPALSADDRAECAALIERALTYANEDARVLAWCADAMIHVTRQYVRGLETARRAAESNPYDVPALGVAGIANLLCGDVEEALAYFHRAARLSPRDPVAPMILTGIAHAHMIRGDYIEALRWSEKSLAMVAHFDATNWMLVAANALLGRMDEARLHLDAFRKREPHVTIASIVAGQPSFDAGRLAAILKGLRLAGLPEA